MVQSGGDVRGGRQSHKRCWVADAPREKCWVDRGQGRVWAGIAETLAEWRRGDRVVQDRPNGWRREGWGDQCRRGEWRRRNCSAQLRGGGSARLRPIDGDQARRRGGRRAVAEQRKKIEVAQLRTHGQRGNKAVDALDGLKTELRELDIHAADEPNLLRILIERLRLERLDELDVTWAGLWGGVGGVLRDGFGGREALHLAHAGDDTAGAVLALVAVDVDRMIGAVHDDEQSRADGIQARALLVLTVLRLLIRSDEDAVMRDLELADEGFVALRNLAIDQSALIGSANRATNE